MSYSIETIKEDLTRLNDRDFYLKYIVRSENWYFENVLGHSSQDTVKISDDFRMTVSEELGISFNSIMIVGSSKIGFSLSPNKLFLPFSVDGSTRKISDIDVAIISVDIFEQFWDLFRDSYSSKYSSLYRGNEKDSGIYCEIYRGYINEKKIQSIDECRRVWTELCGESKKKLSENLYIRNEVTYRIYRSWEDFEEYNLKNIAKIKESMQYTEARYGTV